MDESFVQRRIGIIMMKKSDRRALTYITAVSLIIFAYFTFSINVTDQTIQEVEKYRIISTEETPQ